MRNLRVFFLSAIAAATLATAAFAQMPAYTNAGPIPPALTAAKTIFVSNAGDEDPGYSGYADRAYTQFYAALKAAGDFTLVSDPAQADLVLELRLTVVRGWPAPTFHLTIYDGKSHYILWTVTRSIGPSPRQSTRDKNFDAALSDVLDQFLKITGKAPAAAH